MRLRAIFALSGFVCVAVACDQGVSTPTPATQPDTLGVQAQVSLPARTWWHPVDGAIGVPACDAYFVRFAACQKMPPRSTAEIRRTIAQWRWRLDTGGPGAMEGLATSCEQSAAIWERALADLGC